jgi:uncharacterized membrane protein
MAESSKTAPAPIEEREYYTAMSHFYRGELGRIMVWRQRLDTTTNWAILTATAITTFALGVGGPTTPGATSSAPHIVFMIANFMVFLLLVIEARRYRYYDAYRARVRMLEAHFLVPVVMRRGEMIEGDWRHLVAEDLLLPSFKIGVRESTSRRLKRNYVWIFLILLAAWILKILRDAKMAGEPISGLLHFMIRTQEEQPLPAWLFWLMVYGFYTVILWLAFYAQKERYASGEMERRAPSPKRWKI